MTDHADTLTGHRESEWLYRVADLMECAARDLPPTSQVGSAFAEHAQTLRHHARRDGMTIVAGPS